MRLVCEGIERDYFRSSRGSNIFTAVKSTDFSLEEGRLTEIIGRSGSGKTTFANMAGGMLTPSRGRVILGEEDLYALDDKKRSIIRNRHIGVIPQGQTGLLSLTVLENVLLPAAMYGNDAAKKERAMELLSLVDIAELAEVYAGELSGGEMRRMAIARALVNEPEIIIADEPTGDLDDETTKLVLRLLRSMAEGGASVLMVTHDKEAMEYADITYKMDKGVLSLI